MLGPSKGVAHVSYKGGSLCMPARSPYDKQLLAEEVLRESHMHDTVQILLDDDLWVVRKVERRRAISCALCGRPTDCACNSGIRGEALFCVDCAVGHTSQETYAREPYLAA